MTFSNISTRFFAFVSRFVYIKYIRRKYGMLASQIPRKRIILTLDIYTSFFEND